MANESVVACLKYKESVDTDKTACPHPNDFCKHRTRCVIHMKCMEDPGCREKRRKIFENTR